MQNLLKIKNLKVNIENKLILDGINLEINSKQIHILMGANGSGKSSLALTLMGHPKYQIENGSIEFCKKNITKLKPDERAKLGIFLAMQTPCEIEGVPLKQFIRQAYNSIHENADKKLNLREFNQLLNQKIHSLKINPSLINRAVNLGFSGGEKKKAEILQMMILQPKLAILDEIDSGLDLDALKIVCNQINSMLQEKSTLSFLIITHNPRMLEFINPDFIHIMKSGKISKSGKKELLKIVEEFGFE